MKNKAYQRWLNIFAHGTETLELAGPGDASEGANIVVCRLVTTPLLLPDNLVGPCSKCFRMLQFRPHVPKTPPRMCDECAEVEIEKQRAAGEEVSFMVTQNTLDDIAAMVPKKKRH